MAGWFATMFENRLHWTEVSNKCLYVHQYETIDVQ